MPQPELAVLLVAGPVSGSVAAPEHNSQAADGGYVGRGTWFPPIANSAPASESSQVWVLPQAAAPMRMWFEKESGFGTYAREPRCHFAAPPSALLSDRHSARTGSRTAAPAGAASTRICSGQPPSPWPSWPLSFRPKVQQRPSLVQMTECAALGPEAMYSTGMPVPGSHCQFAASDYPRGVCQMGWRERAAAVR